MERVALIYKNEEFNALRFRLLPITLCDFLTGFRESALRASRASARGPLNAGEAWIDRQRMDEWYDGCFLQDVFLLDYDAASPWNSL